MHVDFKLFSGGPFKIWETMALEAAEFASTLGPDRLINISHSSDNSNGVVIVWYWSEPIKDRKNYG